MLDEAVLARGADRLLVAAERLGGLAAEARELGADERGAVGEVLGQCSAHAASWAWCAAISSRQRGRSSAGAASWYAAMRERGVEGELHDLEERLRRPEQRPRPVRGGDRAGVVAGEVEELQLADPVPAVRDREVRIGLEVALDRSLVEVLVGERAEAGAVSPRSARIELQLRREGVEHEAELDLPHERERGLDLALHRGERLAGEEERDQGRRRRTTRT